MTMRNHDESASNEEAQEVVVFAIAGHRFALPLEAVSGVVQLGIGEGEGENAQKVSVISAAELLGFASSDVQIDQVGEAKGPAVVLEHKGLGDLIVPNSSEESHQAFEHPGRRHGLVLEGELDELLLEVDRVEGVELVAVASLVPPPAYFHPITSKFVAGLLPTSKGVLVVLNAEQVLAIADQAEHRAIGKLRAR